LTAPADLFNPGTPWATPRQFGNDQVMTAAETTAREAGQDFIRDIIRDDLAAGRHKAIVTRFPPEPNGYLHIGHAKSICLNFGVAQEFGGHCNLRYDDTNPTKEDQEFIDAIERDVRWLGFDWGEHLYHASDYFEQLYEWAEHLIRAGKAYVDDQTQEEMRATRGTLTEAGTESPYRGRDVEENLDLFRRMRAGEFPHGARVLRAKIDMGSGNINLRDPVLYRILHAAHPRTGSKWCIYPSYDFAHGQSDSIEGITHSLCTLEFEDHRPLYDWFLQNLPVPSRPHQYEFARLNLSYTVLSKRVLTELVRGGYVGGWDDPRMPTLAGLRRRGVPPAAIRDFVKRIGVAKANSVVDVAMLEFSIREHLNRTAQRRMAVLRPLRIVIENYPEGGGEELDAVNHPEDPAAGTRRVRFGREIFIEHDDFMENPPKKFFRLSPGVEVRLRYAYFITCREVMKNAAGEAIELRCTYDPTSKGGNAPDGRKVKATLHWVSVADAVPAEVRLYNPLFSRPDPNVGNFAADLNPHSLEVLADARVEPAMAGENSANAVQFERQGYFCRDPDSRPGRLVFNRTVGLRDTWAKVSGSG
jgi:glutaminyl-tRNA synthetase